MESEKKKKKNHFDFIGRNIARFKFAQSYFALIFGMITAISTLTIALAMPVFLWFILIPIAIIIVWIIGYIVDKKGIYQADMTKTLTENLQAQKIIHRELWREIIIPMFREMLEDVLKNIINKNKRILNLDENTKIENYVGEIIECVNGIIIINNQEKNVIWINPEEYKYRKSDKNLFQEYNSIKKEFGGNRK